MQTELLINSYKIDVFRKTTNLTPDFYNGQFVEHDMKYTFEAVKEDSTLAGIIIKALTEYLDHEKKKAR